MKYRIVKQTGSGVERYTPQVKSSWVFPWDGWKADGSSHLKSFDTLKEAKDFIESKREIEIRKEIIEV